MCASRLRTCSFVARAHSRGQGLQADTAQYVQQLHVQVSIGVQAVGAVVVVVVVVI